jgi:ferredoxin
MTLKITDECTMCDACVEECPNDAISQPDEDEIYVIDSDKCTECVGFFEEEQCVDVCPADCIVPDRQEDEATLIARAKSLHPDKDFGDDFASKFSK